MSEIEKVDEPKKTDDIPDVEGLIVIQFDTRTKRVIIKEDGHLDPLSFVMCLQGVQSMLLKQLIPVERPKVEIVPAGRIKIASH